MKVFVQVPCLNEESTILSVLRSIPKQIKNVDKIEILIIDDGSSDKTVAIAKKFGVKHFVTHIRNKGLAKSFRDGADYALKHGADILVTTDGDNQYPQKRISDLVQPIIAGTADIVIGDRQTGSIAHFSPFKKLMQRFGSWVVNKAAGTDLPDAASGFRAYSRKSLIKLNIVTQFSYCVETIIQAGNKRLRIASIKIETNKKTRESRLFKNIWHHMAQSAKAVMRSFIMFKPYVVFTSLGVIFLIAGLIPFINFAILWLHGSSRGHIQSLIFGSSMLLGSLLSFALLIISDLLRTNRILIEDQLERIKEMQYQDKK
ncbi:MAG: glycosyltransferase family 2 protein [Candidatus Saccharibacteria bacterium]